MIAHFLAVYPPSADQPLDNKAHSDATSLAVKLAEGPTEAWEAGTWARAPKKHLRVAAAIAMRCAIGELDSWVSISLHQVQDTYQVSAYAAKNAIAELKARGIVGNHGGRISANPRDWVHTLNARQRQARILDLIAIHVASLEEELSGLAGGLSTLNA